MSDVPQGVGWWQAADGKWYPPVAGPVQGTPPSAASKPRRAWRTWQLVTAALVSLLLGIGIGAAGSGQEAEQDVETAADSRTTTTEQTTTTERETTTTTTNPPAPPGKRDNPFPVGQPVELGDWTVAVSGFDPDATDEAAAGNPFNEPAPDGTRYVTLAVTATYHGDESIYAAEVQASLVLANGTVLGGADTPFVVLPDGWNSISELFAGGTVSGKLVWAVPVEQIGGAIARIRAGLFDDAEAWFGLS